MSCCVIKWVSEAFSDPAFELWGGLVKIEAEFFASIENTIAAGEDVLLSGLSGAARTFFLHEITSKRRAKLLCMVPSEEIAYDLARELKSITG